MSLPRKPFLKRLKEDRSLQLAVGGEVIVLGALTARLLYRWYVRNVYKKEVVAQSREAALSEDNSSSTPSLKGESCSQRCSYLIAHDTTPIQNANHFIRVNNPDQYPPYHPCWQPDGYISAAIAENKTISHLLEPHLSRRKHMGIRECSYQDFNGMTHVRQTIAKFFSEYIAGRTIDPKSLLMTAGANIALDSLFYSIADAGEYCLLAQPYYAAFEWDLGLKSGVKIFPVQPSGKDFKCTLSDYQHALAEATKQGKKVRSVLLCNPSNPLGTIATAEELKQLAEWVKTQDGMHLVVDEIYALSSFAHLLSQPNSSSSCCSSSPYSHRPSSSTFVSLAALYPTPASWHPNFHIVYAFSKDFGLSGFRCGLIYTQNSRVHAVFNQLAQFNGLSTDVSHFFHQLLSDATALIKLLRTNRKQLANIVNEISSQLTAVNVPFVAPEAGLFMWIDLRQCLDKNIADGKKAEVALYEELLRECNVNLTPGLAFHSTEPGWFRFCHSAASFGTMKESVRRIASFVHHKKKRSEYIQSLTDLSAL